MGKLVRVRLAEIVNLVNAVVLSPDGQTMATCSWNMMIRVWNSSTRNLI